MSDEVSKIFSKVYTWLGIGLLISFAIGYVLSVNEPLLSSVLSFGILPIIIIELAIAIIMGFRIQKMSPTTTKICYLVYCVTTGITLSSIFIIYKMSSIIMIFATTSIIFGLLAIFGATTKKDLTKIGNIVFIALIGLIVGELLNFLIFKSSGMEMILCGLGVILFVGYILYDVQRIKSLLGYLEEDKVAVYGAFQLYLDFINLFIRLLELFGKRND